MSKEGKTKIVNVVAESVRWFSNLFHSNVPNNENTVSIVVDFSVTRLKKDDLNTFWEKLGKLENPTQGSSSRRQDCGCEPKENLKRLLIEAHQLSICSTSNRPQPWLHNLSVFQGLIDLTLTSHQPDGPEEGFISIPGLANLLCLRLYGVCRNSFCQINLRGFVKLTKLVIGAMSEVKKVKIGGDGIQKIATLKLYNLRQLTEVVYSDNQHPLLKWNNREPVCAETVELDETTFLRKLVHFPADKRNGLMIYHYMGGKCYKYIVCKST